CDAERRDTSSESSVAAQRDWSYVKTSSSGSVESASPVADPRDSATSTTTASETLRTPMGILRDPALGEDLVQQAVAARDQSQLLLVRPGTRVPEPGLERDLADARL